jgi:hypothetical protein
MKIERRHGQVAVPALGAALIILLICCGGAKGGYPMEPPAGLPLFTSSWSDEFDGPAGSLPDRTRWTYDLGNNNGWGNHELETYTNLPANVHLDGNGHLIIHVEKTGSGFTSARLKTKGLLSIRYGRVEARIKLPFGQGIWPAFWMLGDSHVLRGQQSIQDRHAGFAPRRGEMGFRQPILSVAQCGRGWELAWLTRFHHAVPSRHDGRLRSLCPSGWPK